MSDPRIIAVGEEPPPMRADPAPPPERPERPERPDPPAPQRPKGKRKGRFQTINVFIDVTMAELTAAERAVWLILWRDTKADTGLARTSQGNLADRAGVTDRAVRKALVRLAERGLLTVVRRGSQRRGASVYRVRPAVPTTS